MSSALLPGNNSDLIRMASSFTRVISGRNAAVMLAVGAGTLTSGYLFSHSAEAAERRKCYPPRYVSMSVYVCIGECDKVKGDNTESLSG